MSIQTEIRMVGRNKDVDAYGWIGEADSGMRDDAVLYTYQFCNGALGMQVYLGANEVGGDMVDD